MSDLIGSYDYVVDDEHGPGDVRILNVVIDGDRIKLTGTPPASMDDVLADWLSKRLEQAVATVRGRKRKG